MAHGYSVLFGDNACVIENKNSGTKVRVNMTTNRMFPFDVANLDSFALAARTTNCPKLWHLVIYTSILDA